MSNDARKYAFLMIDYEMPEFIKEIQNKIKEEELYVKDDEYGIEKESHVTLVPCLSNDVDLEKLKTYLDDLSNYKIFLTDISKFECEEFDVLKCRVSSLKLFETNEKIKKDYETFSEHKEYSPHLTIAYLKKGMADKYLKKLDKYIVLKPKNFRFSHWENDKCISTTFKT